MENSVNVGGNNELALHVLAKLSCLVLTCSDVEVLTLPVRRLVLWFWVVHVNPCQMNRDYVQKEFWVFFSPSQKILERVHMIVLLLAQQVGTNITAIRLKFILS